MQAGLKLLPWAPQSPDMNPIEHVWMFMKRELREKWPRASSIEMLKGQLLAVWQGLDQERIQKLIDSMPSRVASLRKARGGHTKY